MSVSTEGRFKPFLDPGHDFFIGATRTVEAGSIDEKKSSASVSESKESYF